MTVRAGDEIEQGGLVGGVGCTGSCSGSHLHFEVRVDGVAVDPLAYLPGGFIYTAPPDDEGEPGPGEVPGEPAPEPSPSAEPEPEPEPERSKPPRIRPSATRVPTGSPASSPVP
jgi:hypothetical protein